MNRKTIITVLTILFLPIFIFMGLSWNDNSGAVADTNKPQIIKFSSSMCLECKEVEKTFKEIMPKYSDKVTYTSIIVDSRKDMDNKLIKKYHVQLVPTVVMLDSQGKQVKRIEGAVSKEEYESYIKGLE